MDPINLLLGINLFVTMSANYSGARKGLKTSITKVIDRPVTYLQKFPPNVAALVLIIIIAGIFGLGTFDESFKNNYQTERIIGLLIFIVFSWLQVAAYKALGENYAPDIVVLKGHKLHTEGLYKYLRHPQYLSQFLSDLGAAIALASYLAVPIIILIEIPLFILRAVYEERILKQHFKEAFTDYKKKSGFMIPFIG